MNKNKKQTVNIKKKDNGVSKIMKNKPEKNNALTTIIIRKI